MHDVLLVFACYAIMPDLRRKLRSSPACWRMSDIRSNATIVIFDRLRRENLASMKNAAVEDVVKHKYYRDTDEKSLLLPSQPLSSSQFSPSLAWLQLRNSPFASSMVGVIAGGIFFCCALSRCSVVSDEVDIPIKRLQSRKVKKSRACLKKRSVNMLQYKKRELLQKKFAVGRFLE